MQDVDFAAVTRIVEHRDVPLAAGPWLGSMTWCDLLFAHWRVDARVLRALLPPQLELDLFDGEAWLGVVPFFMRHVRPRRVPEVGELSNFLELNVRTYVTHDGVPGVWFFSLDASQPVAVRAPRRFVHLPYHHASMHAVRDGDDVLYTSRRESVRGDGVPRSAYAAFGTFVGRYGPSGPVAPAERGSLERFLTERYCLYSADDRGALLRVDVHHRPWPLQPAHARIDEVSVQPPQVVLRGAPHLMFAKRLDVVAWAPRRVAAPLS